MTRLRSSSFGAASPRLRRFHLRASRYGGQVAATARLLSFAATACTTAVAVLIGGSSTVLACPVCFGADETSMVTGARTGAIVMLAVTFAVQGGFVGFFFYLRKRAKRIADIELDTEWSELQKAPRTP